MIYEALRATGCDPIGNLALEEALLSSSPKAGSLLLFYVDDPCVVIGRNQNPWVEAAPDSGLPVLRRISGGGAVYHDRGNLNWALIVPRESHDQHAELALVSGALRDLGFPVEPGARGGLYLAADSSFAGCKVSGTARRFGAHGVLHHGTILVAADLGRLSSSLGGIAPASSRAVASVSGRPVNLSALRPGLRVEELATGLVECFASAGLLARASLGSAEEYLAASGASAIAAEARARHLDWEWTWGQTPDFSLDFGEVRIEVSGGRIARVEGPGAESLAGWVGRRFEYDLSKSPARSRSPAG